MKKYVLFLKEDFMYQTSTYKSFTVLKLLCVAVLQKYDIAQL